MAKISRFLPVLLALSGTIALDYATAHAEIPAHDPAFEEMLAHVYNDNPQLRAERDNVRILDERVSQQTANYRPQLSAQAAMGEARVSENEEPWHYGGAKKLLLIL